LGALYCYFVRIYFDYNLSFFREEDIERLQGRLESLLSEILRRPEVSIRQLPIISDAELKKQIRFHHNGFACHTIEAGIRHVRDLYDVTRISEIVFDEHQDASVCLISDRIPQFLDHIWAFDLLKTTAEDQRRTGYYQQNLQRDRWQREALTFADFLAGLELEIEISAMEDSQIARVSQLTQRTNQFNLTTIRRTEAESMMISLHREGIPLSEPKCYHAFMMPSPSSYHSMSYSRRRRSPN